MLLLYMAELCTSTAVNCNHHHQSLDASTCVCVRLRRNIRYLAFVRANIMQICSTCKSKYIYARMQRQPAHKHYTIATYTTISFKLIHTFSLCTFISSENVVCGVVAQSESTVKLDWKSFSIRALHKYTKCTKVQRINIYI